MQTRDALDPRRRGVRRGPGRRRRRLRRGPLRARAEHTRRPVARRGRRGGPRGLRPRVRRAHGIKMGFIVTAMRQFARSVEIAELAVRHRDAGRRRLRRRRARGRLPADALPGRVQPHPPGQLPPDHPRRRGVRAAVDLGGAAVVRRRAPGPRRAHRRRHHGRRRTARCRWAGWRPTCATGACRSRCARRRTSTPAPRRPSRSIRSTCCAGCASASRSTPTTG